MKAWRWIAAVAMVGGAVVLLRELSARGAFPRASDAPDGIEPGGEEPVLGYDGMDRDTLIDWLSEADLDHESLTRIREYETANRGRESVLEAVANLLD